MTINQTLNEADQKMGKAVEVTREDFAAIRTGRANPSMFHKLTADYYGAPTPLQQLASYGLMMMTRASGAVKDASCWRGVGEP